MILVIRELVARELADPETDLKALIQLIMELIVKELEDPERDYKQFDSGN